MCILALADAAQEPGFVLSFWSISATVIDINARLVHPGVPSLWCSFCLRFSSGTIQNRVCEREAYCPNAPLEECGGARCETDLPWVKATRSPRTCWRGMACSVNSGCATSCYPTSKSKCLSTLDVKTGLLSSLIFTEHLWRRKSPWGEGGLIDPRPENGTWIAMATSEEHVQYFKSRYHIMAQLGHTHAGYHQKKKKKLGGVAFDFSSAEWVCHDSESGVAQVNAIKSTVLAIANTSNGTCSDRTQATRQGPLWNHPRTETHKNFIGHHWNKVQTSSSWKIPRSSCFRSAGS